MKAINIFKAVAYVLALPALLLTTACSSDEENIEQTPESFRGYVRHVTINATRDAGDATRAFYDQSQKKLSFSEGDQLFYNGVNGTVGHYALLVDYKQGSTFQGNLYTENPYEGNAIDLFKTGRIQAQLIPAGYQDYGFFELTGTGYNMNLIAHNDRAFAPTKKIAIEQFFFEAATYFDNDVGFMLQAHNGVIGFTLNGLGASKTYNITFHILDTSNNTVYDIFGTTTSDSNGTATFGIGTITYSINCRYSITIDDGSEYMDIDLGYRAIQANHVVNVTSNVTAKQVVNLATLDQPSYIFNHGLILTGELPAGIDVQIADGASVILRDATINTSITCAGDATIILENENTVHGTEAGIKAGPAGKTLTIKGNGQLTVTGADNCAAIGTGNGEKCGNITISGGTVIATGGNNAAAIGTGAGGTCEKIYIDGGWIEATGTGYGAAIGTGLDGKCDQIVIMRYVMGIIVKKGTFATNSIGKGSDGSTIGNVLIGGFPGAKTESPYVYPETHVQTTTFNDPAYFDLAANKDYAGLVSGCTLRSSGGTVVDGHMSGMFYFIAPYNRKFTRITIKGDCTNVSSEGWTKADPGAVWSGTPAQYVHVDCDIENVTQIVLTFQ